MVTSDDSTFQPRTTKSQGIGRIAHTRRNPVGTQKKKKEKSFFSGGNFSVPQSNIDDLPFFRGAGKGDNVVKEKLRLIDSALTAGKTKEATKRINNFQEAFPKANVKFPNPVKVKADQKKREKSAYAPDNDPKDAEVRTPKPTASATPSNPRAPSSPPPIKSKQTRVANYTPDQPAPKGRKVTKLGKETEPKRFSEEAGRRAIKKVLGDDTLVEYEDMSEAANFKKGGSVKKTEKSRYGMRSGGFTKRGGIYKKGAA